jgi:hypothetical protein
MKLCFPIETVPREATLRARGTGLRIDMDASHQRQVDQHAAVNR